MADAETRLKVEEPDREQARTAADFLEHACALGHGGLFLTTADGETVTAEMPVALLTAMQSNGRNRHRAGEGKQRPDKNVKSLSQFIERQVSDRFADSAAAQHCE